MGTCAVCCCFVLFTALSFGWHLQDEEIVYERFTARNPRIIGFFPFIISPYKIGSVAAAPCSAQNMEGTCTTKLKCTNGGGSPYGSCGRNNRGVCCINVKMCSTSKSSLSTSARVTYFQNQGFSSYFSGPIHCVMTIYQKSNDTCQLRIDFQNFELAQPSYSEDSYGKCTTDTLNLGNSGRLPPLCGENTNQHVYIDFNPDSSFHRITIDTSGNSSALWNLKVTQIPCNSTYERAPSGCSMYYNRTVYSEVMSFNFGNYAIFDQALNWTRQINGLHYGICVKPLPGYCSIMWMAEENSFSVTNKTMLVTSVDTNETTTVTETTNCQNTYIQIPQSPNSMGTNTTDRYCGLSFPTNGVTTTATPFILWVFTNLNITTDRHTRGFKMSYKQLPCVVDR